jgi:hypothetical protein
MPERGLTLLELLLIDLTTRESFAEDLHCAIPWIGSCEPADRPSRQDDQAAPEQNPDKQRERVTR